MEEEKKRGMQEEGQIINFGGQFCCDGDFNLVCKDQVEPQMASDGEDSL